MVIEAPARPALAPEADYPAAVVVETQHALPLRRVRRDALPEEIRYRDDGCDVHPHCLTCPLPRCRYDEPGGLRAMLNAYRDQQIVALRGDGAHVDQIAERFGLSRRTVFRILSQGSRQALSATPAVDNGENGHRLLSSHKGRERSDA